MERGKSTDDALNIYVVLKQVQRIPHQRFDFTPFEFAELSPSNWPFISPNRRIAEFSEPDQDVYTME